jgi:hypothetical protein
VDHPAARRAALQQIYRRCAAAPHAALLRGCARAVRALADCAVTFKRSDTLLTAKAGASAAAQQALALLTRLGRQVSALQLRLAERTALCQHGGPAAPAPVPADLASEVALLGQALAGEDLVYSAAACDSLQSFLARVQGCRARVDAREPLPAPALVPALAPALAPAPALAAAPPAPSAPSDPPAGDAGSESPAQFCCWLPSFLRPSPLALCERVTGNTTQLFYIQFYPNFILLLSTFIRSFINTVPAIS